MTENTNFRKVDLVKNQEILLIPFISVKKSKMCHGFRFI